ncbi:MAG: HEPN domain-containing protein, partial [Halobacteriota archaeon]|nr:HEPN domain-containing protein [Halobacteriota archaeon]
LMSIYTHPLLPVQLGGESLHLSAEECKVCKDVWQNLQCLSHQKDQGKLDVGIRKFNDIYDRRFLEDKIIDMSILLESTLLYGDDKELGYRLSLRGAHLLKSNRDTEGTFKLLKKFYDLRSKIVHNGERLNPPVSIGEMPFRPDEFVAEMEAVCREVLRTFIEKVAGGFSISQVNADLDTESLRQ